MQDTAAFLPAKATTASGEVCEGKHVGAGWALGGGLGGSVGGELTLTDSLHAWLCAHHGSRVASHLTPRTQSGRHHDLTLEMKLRPQRANRTVSHGSSSPGMAGLPPPRLSSGQCLHARPTNSNFMPHMTNSLHTQKPDVFSLHQHRVHRVNACFSFE